MVVSLVSVVSPADDASYVSKGVGEGSAHSSAFFILLFLLSLFAGGSKCRISHRWCSLLLYISLVGVGKWLLLSLLVILVGVLRG